MLQQAAPQTQPTSESPKVKGYRQDMNLVHRLATNGNDMPMHVELLPGGSSHRSCSWRHAHMPSTAGRCWQEAASVTRGEAHVERSSRATRSSQACRSWRLCFTAACSSLCCRCNASPALSALPAAASWLSDARGTKAGAGSASVAMSPPACNVHLLRFSNQAACASQWAEHPTASG